MFGLTPSEYDFIIQTVVEPLEKQGATVWCFGSRARGTHQKFSDLDLMVESEQNLSQLISELSDELVESHFPYKVDLVDLRKFAQSYLSHFYAERVLFRQPPP